MIRDMLEACSLYAKTLLIDATDVYLSDALFFMGIELSNGAGSSYAVKIYDGHALTDPQVRDYRFGGYATISTQFVCPRLFNTGIYCKTDNTAMHGTIDYLLFDDYIKYIKEQK